MLVGFFLVRKSWRTESLAVCCAPRQECMLAISQLRVTCIRDSDAKHIMAQVAISLTNRVHANATGIHTRERDTFDTHTHTHTHVYLQDFVPQCPYRRVPILHRPHKHRQPLRLEPSLRRRLHAGHFSAQPSRLPPSRLGLRTQATASAAWTPCTAHLLYKNLPIKPSQSEATLVKETTRHQRQRSARHLRRRSL